MPTHPTNVRIALASQINTLLLVGGGANPTLDFLTSGDAEVGVLPMHATVPFGVPNASTAIMTAGTITDDTTATAGTIAKAVMKDKAGAAVVNLTVSTSGADINLSSLVIANNDTLRITSLTYAPAP